MDSSPTTSYAGLAQIKDGYNASAIQAWAQSLPTHTVGSSRKSDANDAAVQAYLQAKMALFQKSH
jgi:hypothetical protein